ncbi:hypothetical protein HY285_01820 [Candidatus Peregrinibacteria bacterium]|nr:hypothetical protein [Candidatus Peregrinibacteria bacterium]MBI3816265.1 hypothetical protein [Candidatus Peregrinibacteria bacterium]
MTLADFHAQVISSTFLPKALTQYLLSVAHTLTPAARDGISAQLNVAYEGAKEAVSHARATVESVAARSGPEAA